MAFIAPWHPELVNKRVYDEAAPDYDIVKKIIQAGACVDENTHSQIELFILFDIALTEKFIRINKRTIEDYCYLYEKAIERASPDQKLIRYLTKAYLTKTTTFFAKHVCKNKLTEASIGYMLSKIENAEHKAWFALIESRPVSAELDGDACLRSWIFKEAVSAQNLKHLPILVWAFKNRLTKQEDIAIYILWLLMVIKDTSQFKYLVQDQKCLSFLKDTQRSELLSIYLKYIMHCADLPEMFTEKALVRKVFTPTNVDILDLDILLVEFSKLEPIYFDITENYPEKLKAFFERFECLKIVPLYHTEDGRVHSNFKNFPIAEAILHRQSEKVVYYLDEKTLTDCHPYTIQIKHVLDRANEKDWLSVMYIAAMLIEPLLRMVSILRGISISTLDDENKVGTLGPLYSNIDGLIDPKTKILLERYVKKEAYNLRNQVAHGLYTDQAIQGTRGAYGFVALLIMLSIIKFDLCPAKAESSLPA